jgi:hypothetical protein
VHVARLGIECDAKARGDRRGLGRIERIRGFKLRIVIGARAEQDAQVFEFGDGKAGFEDRTAVVGSRACRTK